MANQNPSKLSVRQADVGIVSDVQESLNVIVSRLWSSLSSSVQNACDSGIIQNSLTCPENSDVASDFISLQAAPSSSSQAADASSLSDHCESFTSQCRTKTQNDQTSAGFKQNENESQSLKLPLSGVGGADNVIVDSRLHQVLNDEAFESQDKVLDYQSENQNNNHPALENFLHSDLNSNLPLEKSPNLSVPRVENCDAFQSQLKANLPSEVRSEDKEILLDNSSASESNIKSTNSRAVDVIVCPVDDHRNQCTINVTKCIAVADAGIDNAGNASVDSILIRVECNNVRSDPIVEHTTNSSDLASVIDQGDILNDKVHVHLKNKAFVGYSSKIENRECNSDLYADTYDYEDDDDDDYGDDADDDDDYDANDYYSYEDCYDYDEASFDQKFAVTAPSGRDFHPNVKGLVSDVHPNDKGFVFSNADCTGTSETPVASTNPEDNTCPICMEDFGGLVKVSLSCSHFLCKDCHQEMLKRNPVCPVCRKAFGMLRGNQPEGGTMNYYMDNRTSLPGYERSGTIVITYSIPSGIQTAEHPNPGKRFSGTARTAYLPDNPEGRRVLSLLEKAFQARLTFTVGTSLTTGVQNTVVWNDIHHKTSPYGGPQCFGYPDPEYLNRITEDLAAKGIV